MNHPLSDKDILRYLGDKVNLITYSDVHNYDNIDQLLGRYRRCLILFLNKENYGHWTCLFTNKENGKETLHFFNSYGNLGKKDYDGYPDSFLKYIPKKFRDKSDQNYPYLTDLIVKSVYPVEYNDYQFQKLDDNVKTCGYWCLARLMYSNMTDKQFENFIKDNCKNLKISQDELVVNIINIK